MFQARASQKALSQNIFKSRFYELCDQFSDYYHIFTDGPKVENKVAAAVVHKHNCKSVRRPNNISIFRAELYALVLATEVVWKPLTTSKLKLILFRNLSRSIPSSLTVAKISSCVGYQVTQVSEEMKKPTPQQKQLFHFLLHR